MPFFDIELNRIADSIVADALTFRMHTAAPTNASPTNGRVTGGGGLFASGVVVAPGNMSVAANGDVEVDIDIDFGTAVGAPGTVGWLSAYRGNAPVGFVTLPSTTIASGDTFLVDANSFQINGAST